MTTPRIYFCGDVHGNFDHVIAAVQLDRPEAVIFLGDLEAQQPLHVELAPILELTTIRFVHGNHDTDTQQNYQNLFESDLADCNLHGRVEEICGVRIGGLGGVFRGGIWMPPNKPVFDSYDAFSQALNSVRPMHARFPHRTELSKQERTHRSSIFYDAYCALMQQRADILISHEAPSVHPHGFAAIDTLARAMGVMTAFHGHHHDCRDYSAQAATLGFDAFGVGFCGITSLGGEVISSGDFD